MTTRKPVTIRQLARGILKQHSLRQQLAKAQEECAELIVAIAKYSGMARTDYNEKKVREEIADVQIMIAQLRMIFDEEKCEQELKDKIAKVAERFSIK
jgi:NTP pyrophosphatase (non-canonical NTP hydrolase)